MKISDRELRECASEEYNDMEQGLASELLQRRREVRRLRKALRIVLDKTTIRTGSGPSLAKWLLNPAHGIAKAALKPQRGGK